MISSGMSALCRWICSAPGRIRSSAKRRKLSRTISKSPSRWRRPLLRSQGGQRTRVPVSGDEGQGRVQEPALRTPVRLAAQQPWPPGPSRRRPRRRRPCGPRRRPARRSSTAPGRWPPPRRRGPGRRRPPGWRRGRPGRPPARWRAARVERTLGDAEGRRRRRPDRGAESGGLPQGRDGTGGYGQVRPAGHDGHQGGQHDRVVARVDLGERGQVVRHRPRPDPGRRLGPGVDQLEAGVANQRRQQRADVGMPGVRVRRAAGRRCARPR